MARHRTSALSGQIPQDDDGARCPAEASNRDPVVRGTRGVRDVLVRLCREQKKPNRSPWGSQPGSFGVDDITGARSSR